MLFESIFPSEMYELCATTQVVFDFHSQRVTNLNFYMSGFWLFGTSHKLSSLQTWLKVIPHYTFVACTQTFILNVQAIGTRTHKNTHLGHHVAHGALHALCALGVGQKHATAIAHDLRRLRP